MAEDPVCPHAPSIDANDLGTKDCSSVRRGLLSPSMYGPTLRATGSRYLFPTRIHASPHISIRQYARLVHRWIKSIGLKSASYGTHSMRRTKAAQIYRKTGNLRAVQLLLGHTKLESTVRYLGIEVDDALNMAEQIEL